LFDVKQQGKRFAPPGKIRIRMGVPVRFEAGADPDWIVRELQNGVAKL